MLKIGRWLLTFVLTTQLLGMGSCQGSPLSELELNDPVTISFYHYYSGEQAAELEQQITTFSQTVGKDRGISVLAKGVAGVAQLSDYLLTHSAGSGGQGGLPDLMLIYPDTALELIGRDQLVNLDRYLTPEDLSVFPDSYLDHGRLGKNNHLYLLPYVRASEVVAVNQADWQAFAARNKRYSDLDESFLTWESIMSAAEAYHRWTDGKPLFGFDSLANFIMTGSRQQGIELLQRKDGSGQIDFDREALYQIWKVYYGSMIDGRFAAYSRFRSDDLKAGLLTAAVVSTSAGPYLSPVIVEEDGTTRSADLAILPYPVFRDGQPVCVQQGANLAIARSDDDREIASAILMQWLTRPEQNITFSIPAGYLPVTRPALQSQLLQDYLLSEAAEYRQQPGISLSLQAFFKQMDSYEMYAAPAFPGSYALRDLLSESLQSLTDQAMIRFQQDLAGNANRSDLIYDRYVNDVVFEQWYSQLVLDSQRVLEQGNAAFDKDRQ
ncbi:MAG: extracellular solute-binding protein [Eubacteriales bacterium]|nr:extracellular solute-binding protein [Eubacteriales bacterium]MDD4460868.1 extracellular solute-binding protein [Eubacteriales bacterium]